MRKLLVVFLLAFGLFLPQTVLAVSITINNAPSSIDSNPFNVSLSVFGASAGINYLRAEIYKDGTNNYFGETSVNGAWYGGSSGSSYFPINIVDSKTTASASLQVRVGSPTATEFPGAGVYKLKIKRYTSSGNAASSDDESTVDLTINYSTPTTPTPTPRASVSTISTVKTPIPTKNPTVAKSSGSSSSTSNIVSASNPKQIVNNSDKIATDFAKIQNPEPTKQENVSVLGASKKELPFSIFIASGLAFLLIGTMIFARKNWEQIKLWLEKE